MIYLLDDGEVIDTGGGDTRVRDIFFWSYYNGLATKPELIYPNYQLETTPLDRWIAGRDFDHAIFHYLGHRLFVHDHYDRPGRPWKKRYFWMYIVDPKSGLLDSGQLPRSHYVDPWTPTYPGDAPRIISPSRKDHDWLVQQTGCKVYSTPFETCHRWARGIYNRQHALI